MTKTILITGATSGIGRATALVLAQRGARVIVHGRNPDLTERVADTIRRKYRSTDVQTAIADFSSLSDVHALAERIRSSAPRLDVLINNAGIVARTWQRSAEGFELQWAVNHLAPFLLTNLLLDHLVPRTARIVTVSSRVHAGATTDFPEAPESTPPAVYKPTAIYARTKLANALFAFELARRLTATGITSNCLHPGVVATNLLGDFRGEPRLMARLARRQALSPEEGAETPVYLSLDSEVAGVTGRYFEDRRESEASATANDSALASRLWALSVEQTNLS